MNPRTYHEDGRYYALEPPWHFERMNIFQRIFQLRRHLDRIQAAFDDLEGLYEKCSEEGTNAINDHLDITRHVMDLMESAEVFSYNFPQLAKSTWWGSFTQDVAHAYWRIEDGRYNAAGSDEEELRALLGEVSSILENTTAPTNSQGVVSRLRDFIQHSGYELETGRVPEEYRTDVIEARDLYCLGYYSTALLVLGRSVEKALLELGQARRVKTLRVYGNEERWGDAKFYHRAVALNRINMPEQFGKVLSERQYHLTALLINYRNNVAHTEYEEIGREKALRQLKDAFELLSEISDKIDYLEELDEDKIEPITQQKAQ